MMAQAQQIGTKKNVPIMHGIFTWPSESPHLIGSRCKLCGEVFFPRNECCLDPNCSSGTEEIALSKTGKLVSYTTQMYPPPVYPHPDPFIPYHIALVELPEGVVIISTLVDAKPEQLRKGVELKMVMVHQGNDVDGNDIVTYSFTPAK